MLDRWGTCARSPDTVINLSTIQYRSMHNALNGAEIADTTPYLRGKVLSAKKWSLHVGLEMLASNDKHLTRPISLQRVQPRAVKRL